MPIVSTLGYRPNFETVVHFLDEGMFCMVSFSRIVQITKERTPNMSRNSVTACTLIANDLPMQRLQS